MKAVISLVQVLVGVFLIVLIIIQQKGSGLGSTFGGDLSFYRTKRGAEKLIFYTTFAMAALFILLALIGLAF